MLIVWKKNLLSDEVVGSKITKSPLHFYSRRILPINPGDNDPPGQRPVQ